MPTLKDIAALAGVSVATVSNVINETRRVSPTMRARVEQAASQLGYVARSLDPALVSSQRKAIPSEVRKDDSENSTTATDRQSGTKNATDAPNQSKAGLVLLRLLRAAQPISRVELARRLGLNRSTVTDTFKPLIAAGLVLDQPANIGPARMQGRPSTNLSFNSDRDLFAGVNIGVRRSQVGLTNLRGEILADEDFETPSDPNTALRLIRAAIEGLSHGRQKELRVIAVSVPAPTDGERRKMLYAPRLDWRNIDIADALKLNSSSAGSTVRIVVENDATAAAMYEARLRLQNSSNEPLSNFVLVRSGTGIGVGLVLGGEVYRGTGLGEGLAGEFGHMTIVAGGKPCACGNRGCWEMYASASSASSLYMGERIRLGGMNAPRYVEIVARAETGELRAQRTLERIGEYLGIGIGNVIMGVGVPHVIVSGRIVYGWKFIQEPLHKAVAQSMAGKLRGWSVEPGEPRGAGLGGALEVAVDAFLASSFA
ncbi:MAG TPA: ROK family protein [Pyrinomonadaceae bacterium]|nr:ROK family protein [Pyrinomonadaceae bacterium]